MRGYTGSEDWKHFFAVLHMTEHFFSEDQIKTELNHTEANDNWELVLVWGKGSRN